LLWINETDAAARLHIVDFLEPERRAAAIVKRTYAWNDAGTLSMVDDPMPLVLEQLETAFGVFHGELFFRKRGVDVCVLGTARFEKPVTRARVRIELGQWAHELALVGDRIWSRSPGGELAASEPAPFTEMPIAYARAFGGTTEIHGEDVPWPDNPSGRGYYDAPEQALGKPLPNLETPDASPPRWDARPPVVGWGPYPMYWGLRASRAVRLDPQTGEVIDIRPELFNHAHPDLMLDELDPAVHVRILGLRPHPLIFAIPRQRPRVDVSIGASVFEALGDLDGIFLWADAGRAVVTWRARFRYPVRAEEIRRAQLTFAG
jgi:hypothetical protein